jgi:alkylation response protein AidB-like acyl-CoA dehydrogenase
MALGLRALNRVAGLALLDRIGMRERAERALYEATKNGFRAANATARTFTRSGPRLEGPARQAHGKRAPLFDLTPTDEQRMMREAIGDFALERLRPAALAADAACAAPAELLEQANELGVPMLGVPGALGGAFEERSAVTSALVAEQLARGDMGLAVAALAPAAVGTALGLWGDADQQRTYLAPFAAEKPPSAALALLEPRPLFDPFALETTAKRSGDGFVLGGTKSLVPRAADAELFVIAAALEGGGPALFIVEAGAGGIAYEAEPAMGVRAAGTGRLSLDGVKLGAGSLLADGDPAAYTECVRLARLGWCALAVGTAQAAADHVVKYVNERVAFGEPISHRQAVAFNVAEIAMELEGMRLATLRAASRADQGLDNSREVALARRLVQTKGMRIGSDAVQLLGGHGYTKEHPVERWYRDLRAAGLMEGAVLV